MINALTSPEFWWFYRATIFREFGLLMHGVGVFTDGKSFIETWEEKKSGSTSRRKNNASGP